jgi:hypothetical protein
MAELLPNREQARRLVISLGVFWSAWAVGVISLDTAPLVGGIATVVGLLAAFRFYFTLFSVWAPEAGESVWRMMFVPSFNRSRLRVTRHLLDLFRPSWIRHTLSVTGWPTKIVGFSLLALLLTDAVLAITLLP